MRRVLAAGAVALALPVALAAPAAADPPQPTDYRSVIDAVEPAASALDVEVVGGDAFLEATVDRGHEATVAGYQGEPYLRFRDDGTVERNRRSPATYVNEDRQGGVDLPPQADPEADPEWEEVATGGSYAWHDHRIHWMNEEPPAGEPGEVVQGWSVDMTVDGRPTAVEGRLLWVEPATPWPWLGLGAAAAAGLLVAGRRLSGRAAGAAAAAATVVAAGLALVVGFGQLADAPAGAGASPLLVAVPAVALAAGVAGGAGAFRHRTPVRTAGPATWDTAGSAPVSAPEPTPTLDEATTDAGAEPAGRVDAGGTTDTASDASGGVDDGTPGRQGERADQAGAGSGGRAGAGSGGRAAAGSGGRAGAGGGAMGFVAAVVVLAGVAAVLGWCLLRIEVLWQPVLPTILPAGLDRAGTTLALALATVGAVQVVRSGGLVVAGARAGSR